MKRYVIKKYVMAESLEDALKRERKVKPDDGWLDEKQPEPIKTDAIGFQIDNNY